MHIYAYCASIRPVTTAAVVGASGYAGGELLRLLAGHPAIEVGPVMAGEKAGQRVIDVHPNLAGLHDLMLESTDAKVLRDADVVFLALPHGQSAALVAELELLRFAGVIVDLGADFRLADAADWQRFYGGVHAGTWVYGLPELPVGEGQPSMREQIGTARRIANPGCYPTSVALALVPLAAAGLIHADDIIVVAASGTSGAGRKPTDALLASQVMGSMSAYKVGGTHQHIPEMEQSLRRVNDGEVRLSFTPLLAPMPRGIVATCHAPVRHDVTIGALRTALTDAYRDEPFVTVLPEGVWPQTSSVAGSNSAQLQVVLDEHTGQAVVISAIDNLGKGAAGQALQNANLALGFDETAGLSAAGVAP